VRWTIDQPTRSYSPGLGYLSPARCQWEYLHSAVIGS
jgi:hypothetical protein